MVKGDRSASHFLGIRWLRRVHSLFRFQNGTKKFTEDKMNCICFQGHDSQINLQRQSDGKTLLKFVQSKVQSLRLECEQAKSDPLAGNLVNR
jgi:hypothetical protein